MYLSNAKNNWIDPLVETELKNISNLTEYNVQNLFPDIYSAVSAIYLEFPYETKAFLGHTKLDQLGLSVTINKNIADPARKLFTQAHELGHTVMHNELLKSMNFDFDNDISNKTLKKVEQEANWFAANLILPVQVAYSHILEKHTVKQIRFFSGLSVQSTLFRLDSILKKVYWFNDEDLIKKIIDQYSSCKHSYEVQLSKIYEIFSQGYKLPHKDSYNAILKIQNDSNLLEKLRQNIKLEDSISNCSFNNFHQTIF